MNTLHNHTHFTFNSTGSMQSQMKPFQLFLDEKGNIKDRNKIEYGIYNKLFLFEFKKVLMIKKHFIGLGDIIDWITKITKIKNLIMYITNGNCGCEARRIKFNQLFKFYWFSIKFREIYYNDLHIIPKQKMLLKNIILDKSESKKSSEFINYKSEVKPITQNPVKKSCGCKSKQVDKVTK